MDDFLTLAVALKAGYTVAAVFAALYFSAWLDRRARVDFRVMIAGLVGSPIAAAIYYGARFLAICLLIGLLVGCSSAGASTLFPSRYDAQIRASVARHWPDHPDWLAWRAQLYQESRLRPDAVSPVGAAGLAQFMPGTWRDVVRELRLPAGVSPHSAIAIDAGAYYMAKLRRAWTTPRPPEERQRLAQASYNAGLGNILRAQARCDGARDWGGIAPCLVSVTGPRNAAETRGYVDAIARWRLRMLADGATP